MATYRVTNLDHPDEFTDFPGMVAGFRPASLLPVPYISQLEAGAKQHHNDCGAAAGLMLLKAYKPDAQITVDQFYDLCNPGPDVFLSASQIMGVLSRFDVFNTWRVGMSLTALLDTLRAKKPPMVLIKYGVLVKAKLTENKTFRGGHFAVVVGIDQNFIYTHDPLYKKNNGRPASIQSIHSSMHGEASAQKKTRITERLFQTRA